MRTSRYAVRTSVPVERSRAEIERVITSRGATRFGTMTEPDKATIYFEIKGRQVQLPIPMPRDGKDPTIPRRSSGLLLTGPALERALEQERRRRWRVLLITVKAMLEAVDSKLLTFDEAFLAHIVIPGTGRTLGAAIVPRLDQLYAGMSLPALLAENPE